MISFDLGCGRCGHVFEAWFASSASFDDQRAAGLIPCPLCGGTDVAKAVMAPRIAAKGNQRAALPPPHRPVARDGQAAPTISAAPDQAASLRAALHAVAAAQAASLTQSQWVGDQFADRARAMHYGEADPALIHGQVSRDEAAALREEGVAAVPLLAPFTPPAARN